MILLFLLCRAIYNSTKFIMRAGPLCYLFLWKPLWLVKKCERTNQNCTTRHSVISRWKLFIYLIQTGDRANVMNEFQSWVITLLRNNALGLEQLAAWLATSDQSAWFQNREVSCSTYSDFCYENNCWYYSCSIFPHLYSVGKGKP